MNKNMKMHTQLTVGFIIIGILLIISLYTGYSAAAGIVQAEDQAKYLSSYATVTAIEFIIMLIIISCLSFYISIKIIILCLPIILI